MTLFAAAGLAQSCIPCGAPTYAAGYKFSGSVRKPPVLRPRLRGMVLGMATTKITITLERDQVEAIRALVAAGQAANVSGFVKHAVGTALSDAAGWKEMLQEALQETGGPLTNRERAWADALLAPQGRKRGSRKGKAA